MKRLILFSMMCLVAIASTAQDISGRVIDEQAQPMPFVNVVLVNRADSAFVAGAVTKGKKNEQFSELLYLCTQNEKTDVIYGGSAAYDYTGAERQH